MAKITRWKNLPGWLRGGIIGAVLFLGLWNLLFILAYLMVIPELWGALFYLACPIMHPIVNLMNILFGACYTATKCFFRLPVIFVLMSITEGFIIGAIVQYCKNFTIKLPRIKAR